MENLSKVVFDIGDRVIYTSGRWPDTEFNPLWKGLYGCIVGTIVDADYLILVKWDNGKDNIYNDNDLSYYHGEAVFINELFDGLLDGI